jgi:hypothetical protein
MEKLVSTVTEGLAVSKQCKYSSSVTKAGNSFFCGRSASIFRICTDYCINP